MAYIRLFIKKEGNKKHSAAQSVRDYNNPNLLWALHSISAHAAINGLRDYKFLAFVGSYEESASIHLYLSLIPKPAKE